MSIRAGLGGVAWAVSISLACSGESGEPDEGEAEAVSAEVSACISGHPAAEPFDVGQVQSRDPATLEAIAGECRSSGGSGCDARFISLEAARCIAQSAEFPAGLEPWTLALTYQSSYRRVTWEVQNVLVDEAREYSGESLILDASEGRVLAKTTWRTTSR